MPAHKRHIILGLLLAGFLLWLIYPLYYSIAIEKAKQAQQLRIDTDKEGTAYSNIVLSAAEFRAYYNSVDKELDIDGEMYDVVTTGKEGDNYNCIVLQDENESGLSHALAGSVDHKKNDTDNSTTFWLPIVYCDWPERTDVSYTPVSSLAFGSGHYKYLLPLDYVKKQKRPPRSSAIEA